MVTDSSRPTADTAASNGGGASSLHSQRRSFSPPWTSVVRGDPEQNSPPTAAVTTPGSSSSPAPEHASAPDNSSIEISGSEAHPETPGANGDSNAGQQRSSVWKRPSNGVVEPASVMGGASSWPALGEATRLVPKSPSDNPRPVSDGSASSLQVPIISQPPQRLANNTNNAHGNSTSHNPPTRQKSRNRNGGGGGSGGGNFSGSGGPSHNNFDQPYPPMPPPFPVPHGMVPAVLDTSVRGARPASVGSPSHAGNEYSSPRNNNLRRGNYGSNRPRGDRQYHNNNNNYGGRRDQERSDVHHLPAPPQFVPPRIGFMGSPLPPGAVPLMGPPPVTFYRPGGFDMAPPLFYVSAMPPESFRAMPLVPSPPPMLFPPVIENSLTSMIVKQIDFYFSDDNLVKDNYLRSNMDDQGWVPIGLIASFRRVQLLTQDIPVILESLRYSEVVEVQGDKLRRRDGWNKWIHSSARRNSDYSGTDAQSSSAPENSLANSLQEISLNNADCNVDVRESQLETAEGGISNGKMLLPTKPCSNRE